MVKKDPSLGVCGINHVRAGSLSHLGWTEREWEQNGRFNRTDGNESPTAIEWQLKGL